MRDVNPAFRLAVIAIVFVAGIRLGVCKEPGNETQLTRPELSGSLGDGHKPSRSLDLQCRDCINSGEGSRNSSDKAGNRSLRADVIRLASQQHKSSLTVSVDVLATEDVETLAGMSNIQSLRIIGATIRQGSLVELKRCRMLNTVSLDGCQLSHTTGSELSALPALVNLQLVGSTLTDDGLEHVSSSLTLRELDLRGTRITDKGLESLRQCPRLQVLDVRGTGVTAAAVGRLACELPRVKVYFRSAPSIAFRLVRR